MMNTAARKLNGFDHRFDSIKDIFKNTTEEEFDLNANVVNVHASLSELAAGRTAFDDHEDESVNMASPHAHKRDGLGDFCLHRMPSTKVIKERSKLTQVLEQKCPKNSAVKTPATFRSFDEESFNPFDDLDKGISVEQPQENEEDHSFNASFEKPQDSLKDKIRHSKSSRPGSRIRPSPNSSRDGMDELQPSISHLSNTSHSRSSRNSDGSFSETGSGGSGNSRSTGLAHLKSSEKVKPSKGGRLKTNGRALSNTRSTFSGSSSSRKVVDRSKSSSRAMSSSRATSRSRELRSINRSVSTSRTVGRSRYQNKNKDRRDDAGVTDMTQIMGQRSPSKRIVSSPLRRSARDRKIDRISAIDLTKQNDDADNDQNEDAQLEEAATAALSMLLKKRLENTSVAIGHNSLNEIAKAQVAELLNRHLQTNPRPTFDEPSELSNVKKKKKGFEHIQKLQEVGQDHSNDQDKGTNLLSTLLSKPKTKASSKLEISSIAPIAPTFPQTGSGRTTALRAKTPSQEVEPNPSDSELGIFTIVDDPFFTPNQHAWSAIDEIAEDGECEDEDDHQAPCNDTLNASFESLTPDSTWTTDLTKVSRTGTSLDSFETGSQLSDRRHNMYRIVASLAAGPEKEKGWSSWSEKGDSLSDPVSTPSSGPRRTKASDFSAPLSPQRERKNMRTMTRDGSIVATSTFDY